MIAFSVCKGGYVPSPGESDSKHLAYPACCTWMFKLPFARDIRESGMSRAVQGRLTEGQAFFSSFSSLCWCIPTRTHFSRVQAVGAREVSVRGWDMWPTERPDAVAPWWALRSSRVMSDSYLKL